MLRLSHTHLCSEHFTECDFVNFMAEYQIGFASKWNLQGYPQGNQLAKKSKFFKVLSTSEQIMCLQYNQKLTLYKPCWVPFKKKNIYPGHHKNNLLEVTHVLPERLSTKNLKQIHCLLILLLRLPILKMPWNPSTITQNAGYCARLFSLFVVFVRCYSLLIVGSP